MSELRDTSFWTVQQALDWAKTCLRRQSSITSPEQEGRALLDFVLGTPSSFALGHPDELISERERMRFERLVRRRETGEPRAYLLGSSQFWGLDLRVTPAVLDPRPETELCVEHALEIAARTKVTRAADVGTGSGNIALAFACERRDVDVLAVDIERDALAVAERNAVLNQLDSVTFAQMNWLDACAAGTLDLVISNPPYVESSYPLLRDPDSVLRFEPRRALDGGLDPRDTFNRLVASADRALGPNGHLVLEHGADQGEMVRAVLHFHRFGAIETVCDLAGHARVTFAERSG